MWLTLWQEGREGFLLVKTLKTVEQKINLITIVLSMYDSAMLFYHGHIRDAYLMSCAIPRGGLSGCTMIYHMEVYLAV